MAGRVFLDNFRFRFVLFCSLLCFSVCAAARPRRDRIFFPAALSRLLKAPLLCDLRLPPAIAYAFAGCLPFSTPGYRPFIFVAQLSGATPILPTRFSPFLLSSGGPLPFPYTLARLAEKPLLSCDKATAKISFEKELLFESISAAFADRANNVLSMKQATAGSSGVIYPERACRIFPILRSLLRQWR